MSGAGRRDQRVTLQRATTTQDEYGEDTPTWADLGTEWAAVFYGRGEERRQAAAQQGQQAASFRMLANPVTRGLTVRDRIVLGADAWDIVGVAPLDRATVEATAVRSA